MTEIKEHDGMICRSCGNEERASEGYPCANCGTFLCHSVTSGVWSCARPARHCYRKSPGGAGLPVPAGASDRASGLRQRPLNPTRHNFRFLTFSLCP